MTGNSWFACANLLPGSARVTIVDPLAESSSTAASKGSDFPNEFKIKTNPSYGLPLVIETLWERLGLTKILEDITAKRDCRSPYARALLAMVSNRLCSSESKLGVWDRPAVQGLSAILRGTEA